MSSVQDMCSCQKRIDDFFRLLNCAPPAFFGVWLSDDTGDCLLALSGLAATCPSWASVLVDACLIDLLRHTPCREEIFRQDRAATRCMKALLDASFTAAVGQVLLRAVTAKQSDNAGAQANRLVRRLAAVSMPPLVRLVAHRVATAFDEKFAGAGRVALVGLFWLRLLCPLLLKLAADFKPSKHHRVVELVKHLQAKANSYCAVGAAAQPDDLGAAIEPLLAAGEAWPTRLPATTDVCCFAGWTFAHSLQLGRTLKSSKALFDEFTASLIEFRQMTAHRQHTDSDSDDDYLPLSPRSSLMSLSHLRTPAKASLSCGAISDMSLSCSSASSLRAGSSLSTSSLTVSSPTVSPLPRSPPSREELLGVFSSFSPRDVAPVNADGLDVPVLLAAFSPRRADVEAWTPADVGAWLSKCGLAELVEPFRAAGVDGRQLLALHNKSPLFLEQGTKIGIVRQFSVAKKALLRSTVSVFDDSQFESSAEQLRALKEFIVRVAQHVDGQLSLLRD